MIIYWSMIAVIALCAVGNYLTRPAINANSSQIIAALKPTIDFSDDSFIIIDKATKEKQLVYYIPYKNILMIMKG